MHRLHHPGGPGGAPGWYLSVVQSRMCQDNQVTHSELCNIVEVNESVRSSRPWRVINSFLVLIISLFN